ncbi:hypothetical protein CC1G_00590 [Coprinopsis cinerea okayama7|uniref:F-box domain-containing protein n=1 Tax=Coprinopsis cinerea (strain Okayama-7 / 130 / ATCC MYA-4618 / FGSC 9003) TaxID=240176 RepID=A8N3R9_COPC7|nr:hypothetical protein CC1G_00590 [Coprinopsis cinerea okayama7\|eukprot:XP_001829411.1 hypothetical protein CC1G_00590 [Coprinopsis cinerea okayama7\
MDSLPEELLHRIIGDCLFTGYAPLVYRALWPLQMRRKEGIRYSLVCKRWHRIALPILLETTLVDSQREANRLATLFNYDKTLGKRVKKLRFEGGYGQAAFKILQAVPNLTHICVSLSITSKDSVKGLCKGLRIINPAFVALRDPNVQANKQVRELVSVLIECMTVTWSNMTSYDHAYEERDWKGEKEGPETRARRQRAIDLADAISRVPNLHTIWVPAGYTTHVSYSMVLSAARNPAVKKVYSWTVWHLHPYFAQGFMEALDSHPRLREMIHFQLPGPWAHPTFAPIGDRTMDELLETFTFYGPFHPSALWTIPRQVTHYFRRHW